MSKRKIFIGANYKRGGRMTDKHGNVIAKPVTYRNVHSGVVVSGKGKVVGIEVNRKHQYGSDYRKRKGLRKPFVIVKPNHPFALKRRSTHTRRL